METFGRHWGNTRLVFEGGDPPHPLASGRLLGLNAQSTLAYLIVDGKRLAIAHPTTGEGDVIVTHMVMLMSAFDTEWGIGFRLEDGRVVVFKHDGSAFQLR